MQKCSCMRLQWAAWYIPHVARTSCRLWNGQFVAENGVHLHVVFIRLQVRSQPYLLNLLRCVRSHRSITDSDVLSVVSGKARDGVNRSGWCASFLTRISAHRFTFSDLASEFKHYFCLRVDTAFRRSLAPLACIYWTSLSS